MMSEQQQVSVPVDRVLAVTQQQRNNVLDELAMAQVLIEHLTAERDELAAEVKQLRGSPSPE
ncbi:hypothetical protein AB0K40_17705 [Nonomuraea bangladeshensis]|uniref:Uncharacterized protein n=1 Tax=Nonomuraea bangladeshensis TaxID=404385 RepID=A0ABV3H487_9ACTN